MVCPVSTLDARQLPSFQSRTVGSIDARKEECREALGLRLLDELRSDVVYALRLLPRSPAFTAVALLSVGLGIGANTAVLVLAVVTAAAGYFRARRASRIDPVIALRYE